MSECELCGTQYEKVPGKGMNNRVSCYDCTNGDGDRRATYRNKHLKRNFGITFVQFHQMIVEQGAECKICGSELSMSNSIPEKGAKRVGHDTCVDHDHKTGKVRGILCFHCNTALGHAGDDPARLIAMAEYLYASR